MPFLDHLSIFPAFSPPQIAICRVCCELFDRDMGRQIFTERGRVSQVSIYLRDFSDMTVIRNLVKDMSTSFPGVAWLNFSLEHPIQVS